MRGEVEGEGRRPVVQEGEAVLRLAEEGEHRRQSTAGLTS